MVNFQDTLVSHVKLAVAASILLASSLAGNPGLGAESLEVRVFSCKNWCEQGETDWWLLWQFSYLVPGKADESGV